LLVFLVVLTRGGGRKTVAPFLGLSRESPL
jgi:hypothetical protein